MFNKIILTITIGVMLSGCFMAPMAFIGPVSSGFSTASIIQSGVSSVENYIVYGLALYFVLIIDPAISLLFSSSLNINLVFTS